MKPLTEIWRTLTLLPLLLTVLLLIANPVKSQEFIADSFEAKEIVLRNIPKEYIDKARTELVIAYQHTSHGTHVSRGLYGLQDYKPGDSIFGVSLTPDTSKLEFRDFALEDYAPPGVDGYDLSIDETAFIQTTRNYLDAPENAVVNVVMWSWCDIADHHPELHYLPGMDNLIAEYGQGGTKIGTEPGQRETPVTFIYMTGHANVNDNTGPLNPKEQAALIVDSCIKNQRYCLDYYSIDTHAMDDIYYEDAGDNGNSSTYGGNFYIDWQNSHTLGTDYFENKLVPGGSVVFGEHNTQHITANRKAYAMWWILARIAGWDGSYHVSAIEVASEGDTTQVMTGDTLRFSATVWPDFADNPDVVWSVLNDTGTATISSEGLLRGGQPGNVKVVATALDGSGVSDTMALTITPPLVSVTSITVTTAGDVTEFDVGTPLQCSVSVLPLDASNPAVIWSVNNNTGTAIIATDGMVTGVTEGNVEVIATAEDGSLVADTVQLTVNGLVVLVTNLEVSSSGDVTQIITGEDLQFSAAVLPLDASNTEVDWSVVNGTGSATVTTGGLVTALTAGTVEVVATATDGSLVSDSFSLTIITSVVLVSEITISSAGDVNQVEEGGTLQLTASVLPLDASNPAVTWIMVNGTGTATISNEGLVAAGTAGTVDVVAMAVDGSEVNDTFAITITSSLVLVTDIVISSANDVSEVDEGSTLQFYASVLPADATNKLVSWSINNLTGTATICDCGTLTTVSMGTVEVVATAQDGSGVSDSFTVTINGPSGLSEGETRSNIVLYPNPSQGVFYLDAGDLAVQKMEVISVEGTMVLELVPEPGQRVIEIDLSDQQPGAFFIHAYTKEESFVQRLIITR